MGRSDTISCVCKILSAKQMFTYQNKQLHDLVPQLSLEVHGKE